MSLSSSLAAVGQVVAYYPKLARFFGSLNAAIFFSQLYYWQSRSNDPLGVFKTADEWTEETGLSYREQVTARRKLISIGVLVETEKRLVHRTYYWLDLAVVDAQFEAWCRGTQKPVEAEPEGGEIRPFPPNDENAFREMRFPQFGNDETVSPELRFPQSVNKEKITAEITHTEHAHESQNVCVSVDNSLPKAVCDAMTEAGVKDANAGNTKLKALLESGVELSEFTAAATDAVTRGKGFAYALGVVANRRKEVAAMALPPRPADVARATVPGKPGRDPALVRIEAEAARAVPPPPEIRARLAAMCRPHA